MSNVLFPEDFKLRITKEFPSDFVELHTALDKGDDVFVAMLLKKVMNFPEVSSERSYKMRLLLGELQKLLKEQEMSRIKSLSPLPELNYLTMLPQPSFGVSHELRILMVFPDGAILFLDGEMAGGALEAQAVHGFWLETIGEQLVLGLTFQRGAKVERIALGEVKNKLTALQWIEAVNALYSPKQ